LVSEAVDAARRRRIDPCTEECHRLGGAAGAGEEAMHRLDLAGENEVRLFLSLAARHIELAFAVVIDETRDDLELPGGKTREMGGQPKLLDEHHRIARGIVEQHAHGATALEHLARQLRAPAPGEEPMAQAVTVDAEKSLIRDVAVEDLQRFLAHGAAENETAVSSTAAL